MAEDKKQLYSPQKKATKKVEDMTKKELKIYEKKLLKRLKYVHIHQQKLSDQKMKCIICKQRDKNVILNGCNHLDICSECEKRLAANLCPSCFTEYDEAFVINL